MTVAVNKRAVFENVMRDVLYRTEADLVDWYRHVGHKQPLGHERVNHNVANIKLLLASQDIWFPALWEHVKDDWEKVQPYFPHLYGRGGAALVYITRYGNIHSAIICEKIEPPQPSILVYFCRRVRLLLKSIPRLIFRRRK